MQELKAVVEEQLKLAKNKETKDSLNIVLNFINDYLENEELEFEMLMQEIPLDIGKRPVGAGLFQNH